MNALPNFEHHDDADECSRALSQVQAFLHGELGDDEADLIRLHLDACEKCLDDFDVEQAITLLVRRCNPTPCASAELRMRIVQISATLRTED